MRVALNSSVAVTQDTNNNNPDIGIRTVVLDRNLANHHKHADSRAETNDSDLGRRCIKSSDCVHALVAFVLFLWI